MARRRPTNRPVDLAGTRGAAAWGRRVRDELEPAALLDAGRADLAAGDRAAAAVHLGLVVRLAPALAPAVLSIIGEATDAGLQLVQGDAYRAVGHESEARRAYASAMTAAATLSAEHRARQRRPWRHTRRMPRPHSGGSTASSPEPRSRDDGACDPRCRSNSRHPTEPRRGRATGRVRAPVPEAEPRAEFEPPSEAEPRPSSSPRPSPSHAPSSSPPLSSSRPPSRETRAEPKTFEPAPKSVPGPSTEPEAPPEPGPDPPADPEAESSVELEQPWEPGFEAPAEPEALPGSGSDRSAEPRPSRPPSSSGRGNPASSRPTNQRHSSHRPSRSSCRSPEPSRSCPARRLPSPGRRPNHSSRLSPSVARTTANATMIRASGTATPDPSPRRPSDTISTVHPNRSPKEVMPSTERTLVLVKPDGVQRQLVGRILAPVRGAWPQDRRAQARPRRPRPGGARTTPSIARSRSSPASSTFITSAPLVAVALEGPNAIAVVRAINGATRPHEAAPGTIRGDFALETAQNIVHASDGPEAAVTELALWFRPAELYDYDRDIDRWVLARRIGSSARPRSVGTGWNDGPPEPRRSRDSRARPPARLALARTIRPALRGSAEARPRPARRATGRDGERQDRHEARHQDRGGRSVAAQDVRADPRTSLRSSGVRRGRPASPTSEVAGSAGTGRRPAAERSRRAARTCRGRRAVWSGTAERQVHEQDAPRTPPVRAGRWRRGR